MPALNSSHSKDRKKERKITDAEAQAVLNDPEIEVPARQGRRKVGKTINGRRVWVVYIEMQDGSPFVISVMKDD